MRPSLEFALLDPQVAREVGIVIGAERLPECLAALTKWGPGTSFLARDASKRALALAPPSDQEDEDRYAEEQRRRDEDASHRPLRSRVAAAWNISSLALRAANGRRATVSAS